MSVRHLYVHVPFCAHRCGYCDFVTVTGHEDVHAQYVAALLAELEMHGAVAPETIYIGGGTPSLLSNPLLATLLGGLPPAVDVTVECNPETVTPEQARVLREGGVTRISLGAQSFQSHLLATLERRARPETVMRAVEILRAAGHSNLNLDLMFGVPGQSPADLAADIAAVLALRPDHISWYELEAKPGTRFAVHHGAELAHQAEALEDHYETVVAALRGAGYQLVRDRELLPSRAREPPQPRLLARARLPRHRRRSRVDARSSSGAATGRACPAISRRRPPVPSRRTTSSCCRPQSAGWSG